MSLCSIVVFDPQKKQEIIEQMQNAKNFTCQSHSKESNPRINENDNNGEMRCLCIWERIKPPLHNTLDKETLKDKKVRKTTSLITEQDASDPCLFVLKALQSNEKSKKVSPKHQNE